MRTCIDHDATHPARVLSIRAVGILSHRLMQYSGATMAWYEALMAFSVVMSLIIAPTVVLIKRRKAPNTAEIEHLRERLTEVERRLTDEQDETRRLHSEVAFVTRLIEQKPSAK